MVSHRRQSKEPFQAPRGLRGGFDPQARDALAGPNPDPAWQSNRPYGTASGYREAVIVEITSRSMIDEPAGLRVAPRTALSNLWVRRDQAFCTCSVPLLEI